MTSEKPIVDLQIFLGRISETTPSQYEGIPSLLTDTGFTTRSRDISQQGKTSLTLDNSQPIFIAIANSEVIEMIKFPFSMDSVKSILLKLQNNRLSIHDCISCGEKLFDFVFYQSIRDLFRQYTLEDNTLRITIVTTVPELLFLPWELMCDTFPGVLPNFLCYDPHIYLIRSLKLSNRSHFANETLGDQNELRILLVTANPVGTFYIDVLKEQKMLEFVCEEQLKKNDNINIRLEPLHDANIQNLHEKLIDFKPHIVHLACHGGYSQEDNLGFICLNSTETHEKRDDVNSYRFAALINEAKSVQLVFVNTCYGAFQETSSEFSGIAQCLHAIGIPDVIALQFVLLDTTAHIIVLNFYKYLIHEGLCVEECVTKVRRQLFINGNILQEVFGLSIYQGNISLSFKSNQRKNKSEADEDVDFKKINKLFENFLEKEIEQRLSMELENISAKLKNLNNLDTEDLLLTIKIFDDNLDLGLRILQEINQIEIPLVSFLHILKIVQSLSLNKHENKPIQTVFILKRNQDFEKYLKDYNLPKNKELKFNIIDITTKALIEKAIKATGENYALFAVSDQNNPKIKMYMQKLHENTKTKPIGIDEKWANVCSSVQHSGCALIVPGDARVKIILKGEQIAEFKGGTWQKANMKDIQQGFINLSKQEDIDNNLCLSIMEKCLLASEKRRGFTLILQRKDKIRLNPGYNDVSMQEDTMGIKEVSIETIKAQQYLDIAAGDNAVIISREGLTLALNASTAYSSSLVKGIPGHGSRHLSAQMTTKNTDAIAFVVSEDGPISIFKNGERWNKYL